METTIYDRPVTLPCGCGPYCETIRKIVRWNKKGVGHSGQHAYQARPCPCGAYWPWYQELSDNVVAARMRKLAIDASITTERGR
jgi:hypothetical protein